MSRTIKNRHKFGNFMRRVKPYRRQERKQMLAEFEDEYRWHNAQPGI